MARVEFKKAVGKKNNAKFDNLKSKEEKVVEEEDVKPIIKPRNFIEPGTVIDLESCINTSFDDKKRKFREMTMNSPLSKMKKNIEAMIAKKKKREERDPFEALESLDDDYKFNYNLEKLLRGDQTEMLTKMAAELAAEEVSVEKMKMSKRPSKKE